MCFFVRYAGTGNGLARWENRGAATGLVPHERAKCKARAGLAQKQTSRGLPPGAEGRVPVLPKALGAFTVV